MDDKTLAALTELAQKLGTTAEYLWGVLIKQAPISGATDLICYVFLICACWLWARYVYKKTNSSEWYSEGAFCAWFSVGAIVLLSAFLILASLSTTVAAFVNPEYWALKQILK